jgi:hypothetical protein
VSRGRSGHVNATLTISEPTSPSAGKHAREDPGSAARRRHEVALAHCPLAALRADAVARLARLVLRHQPEHLEHLARAVVARMSVPGPADPLANLELMGHAGLLECGVRVAARQRRFWAFALRAR